MGFIRSLSISLAMVVVAVVAQPGWGEGVPISPGQVAAMVVLEPNDAGSIATIESEDGDFQIRVVVAGEASASSDTEEPIADLDPEEPARTAIEFPHPNSGAMLQINFVELLPRRVPGLGGTEIVINSHLPFSRNAEIRFLNQGLEIRRVTDLPTVHQAEVDPACWVTGDAVLEIPVLVPIQSTTRDSVPMYTLQIVGVNSPPIIEGYTSQRGGDDGDGGTPGGSPDPDFLQNTGTNGLIILPPDNGEGGTPGGSPDPDFRRR